MTDIAVTGGIACGKSLVTDYFAELGARVCSADGLVHDVLKPMGEAYAGVVEQFGDKILDEAGEIDRRRLGRLVFGDEVARRELEQLVHGPVKRRIRDWLAGGASSPMSVVEVPLLYEAGMADDGWDAVVCVVAPQGVQIARLTGMGFSIDEARARINAQWSVEQKAVSADYVVINGAGKGLVREQVELIWQRLMDKKS